MAAVAEEMQNYMYKLLILYLSFLFQNLLLYPSDTELVIVSIYQIQLDTTVIKFYKFYITYSNISIKKYKQTRIYELKSKCIYL